MTPDKTENALKIFALIAIVTGGIFTLSSLNAHGMGATFLVLFGIAMIYNGMSSITVLHRLQSIDARLAILTDTMEEEQPKHEDKQPASATQININIPSAAPVHHAEALPAKE